MTAAMTWDEALQVGRCVDESVDLPKLYGMGYWDEYVRRSATPMGKDITRCRIKLVDKWATPHGRVVDIGIGSGQFVETRGSGTWGYDVNPLGIRWLLDRGLWWDPWFRATPNATTWDSLEHMDRPELLLQRVQLRLFVSIPIFRDKAHALGSKHWKPGEHVWFFTRDGLVRWMKTWGFGLLEENRMEEALGRQDIGTFVFGKIGTFLQMETR